MISGARVGQSAYHDRLPCALLCVLSGTVCDSTSQEDAALPDVVGANTRRIYVVVKSSKRRGAVDARARARPRSDGKSE